ncbi:MAG: transporter [Ramlibacter sp.]|jgi:MFS family permease|nr:transporter [Ramlibacter sp.]
MTPAAARHATGRWYFGWNIVAAGSLLTLLTVGMRMSIGPFFLPIAADLGFSRSLLAAIVAVGMLVYGVAMPLAAHLVNLRGTRFVLLCGTAMVVAGAGWTVVARDAASFLLAFGVLLSVGLAFTGPVAMTPVISKWFERQRGMALLFLSTGSMAGMAIMTPVLSLAIGAFGWQRTLIGFAGTFLVLALPLALLVVRDDAPEHKDVPPGKGGHRIAVAPAPLAHLSLMQAIRTAPFVMVALGLFACGYSMNLLGAHGMPMLMDHGFDAASSSLGIGLIGAVAILGTLILGRMADRLPRKNLLAAIYFVRGLGFFALVVAGTHMELYAVSVIGGLVWAGSIALSSAILADVYGIRLVGVLYGWTYVGHQVGGMISSWLGGWGFDTWGTHWPAFGSAGVLLLLAAAVVLRLPSKEALGEPAALVARS